MAEPGASLAVELRALLPQLRAAVGNDRRVLVGFDRGGWSPALFAHMHAQGFDVLTWRKVPAANVHPDLFTDLTYVDETGRTTSGWSRTPPWTHQSTPTMCSPCARSA
jgi:hypothetical protein